MHESSRRTEKPGQQEEVETKETEQAETDTRFAGGKPPPVGGGFNDQASASTLAYEDDDNTRELKQKVGKLVANKFGGDVKMAFEHYGKDGCVGKGELVKLLGDAGVGNGLTRGTWASKIIDTLDKNNDGAIDWSEFESVFHATA